MAILQIYLAQLECTENGRYQSTGESTKNLREQIEGLGWTGYY